MRHPLRAPSRAIALAAALATALAAAASAAPAAAHRLAPPATEAPPAPEVPTAEAPPPAEAPPAPRRMVIVDGHRSPHSRYLFLGRGPYLGVELIAATPELRRHFGAPEDRGMLVGRVEEGSPAEAAGVAVGDLLLSIGGEPIESVRDARHALAGRDGGEAVEVELWRDGAPLGLVATLEERERPRLDLPELAWYSHPEVLPELPEIPEPPEIPDLDRLRIHRLEVDPEIVGSLEEALGPGVRERLAEYRARNRELEERLAALEARLEELERSLDR